MTTVQSSDWLQCVLNLSRLWGALFLLLVIKTQSKSWQMLCKYFKFTGSYDIRVRQPHPTSPASKVKGVAPAEPQVL